MFEDLDQLNDFSATDNDVPELFEENVVEPMNDIDEVTMKETYVPRREECDTSNC